MPHVWAKSDLKWKGFEPRSYSLDTDKLWKLPLTKKPGGEATTVGVVVAAFQGKQVEVDDPAIDLTIKSDSASVTVTGPSITLQLLKLLYDFAEKGVSPFDVRWFYVDSDSCRAEPESSYTFFLVAGDRIINEHYSLFDSIQSGFDPSLLSTYATDPLWSNERHWAEANDRFWYRKFYTETRYGQLLVLRPDEPRLYFFDRAESDSKNRDFQHVLLLRSYRLLMILVLLVAAIGFREYRAIFGGIAAVFFLDFLSICWQTRKIGL